MKNRKILAAAMIIGLICMLNGCIMIRLSDGDVVSQERSVGSFRGVILEGAGNVNIYHSENFRVVVTADSCVQENIITKISGNYLVIDRKGVFSTSKLKIDVYMPELSYVELEGAGNIKINDGYATNLRLILSGYGNIDARNFQAENVNVVLSGAGDIKTWAAYSLTGTLSGVGSIMYRGYPYIININRTGIGTVEKI